MKYKILSAVTQPQQDGQPLIVVDVEFDDGSASGPMREQLTLTCEDKDGAFRLFELRRRELETNAKEVALADKEAALATVDPIAERREKMLAWLNGHIAAGTVFGE